MTGMKKRANCAIRPSDEQLMMDEGRYWSAETAPVPEDVGAALKRGPMDPGYHDVEIGYGFCPDGVQYAACLTDMPGITAEMIDWWFAWHPLHDIRYRIWFPPGHYGVSVEDPDKCRDSSLSYRERYWHKSTQSSRMSASGLRN
jgi:hypothetical protein